MTMNASTHEQIDAGGRVPIRAWTRGVEFEPGARAQVVNLAKLPLVHRWIAVMPAVHQGIGAAIGSFDRFTTCARAPASNSTPRVQERIGTRPPASICSWVGAVIVKNGKS
ncbi:MAG: hypothetical protein NVSMB47_15960 [Polyangiales bacterium]